MKPLQVSTMVDREGRRELQLRLKQLIAGQISNDAFFLTRFGSDDPSLPEIWSFGNALIHDYYPARLRSPNKLSKHKEELACRCLLFLGSNLEYEWPKLSSSTWWYWLFVSGSLSLALGTIAARLSIRLLPIVLVLLGAIACTCSFAYQRCLHKRALAAFEETGDRSVWPFLRRSDYERQKANHGRQKGTS